MFVRNMPEGERWWATECSLKYNDIHWHSFFELEIVLDGSAYTNINGYETKLVSGMMTFLSPYDFHKIDTCSENEISFLKIGFCEKEISEEIRKLLQDAHMPLIMDIDNSILPDMIEQLKKIENTINSESVNKNFIIRRQIELLILDILSQISVGGIILRNENEFCESSQVNTIRALLLYINTHYHEKIDRDKVAENLHYSPNYLSNLFKKATGYTMSDYIMKVRMFRAYELLTSSDKTINEIIQRTGFRSQTLFYRSFKKFYGKTPSEIKNQAE